MIRDQNGRAVFKHVRQEEAGWGCNVWFGGCNGLATSLRRHYYRTRAEARNADISDGAGVLRHGPYLAR